jgi:hypothetical protein
MVTNLGYSVAAETELAVWTAPFLSSAPVAAEVLVSLLLDAFYYIAPKRIWFRPEDSKF